jgi:hypothetical protein
MNLFSNRPSCVRHAVPRRDERSEADVVAAVAVSDMQLGLGETISCRLS